MRIIRIDFEGQTGNFATVVRQRDSQHIDVTILKSDMPDGREHHVLVDSREDIYSMAECLQYELDGCRGTNSMIHDYFRELLRLSDC